MPHTDHPGGGARVRREPFATWADGTRVDVFTLTGAGGIEVRFIEIGGIIVSVRAPDRDGRLADVTLGYDDLASYGRDPRYFGALVGRYANRIARGRFTLDGETHALATNDGANHLHGGIVGFNARRWRVEPFDDARGAGATLAYTSPDGEEGYPGTLDVRVTYALDGDVLSVDYEATTDRATPVNLTQHAYWNLAGHDHGDVLGHELTLHASRTTPVDAGLIPTGELRDVRGTPFDFSRPTPIGERIDADDEQLRHGSGYDHNWVIDGADGTTPVLAARLRDPASGRTLELRTTEPGVQVYAGNFLDRGPVGKGGVTYRRRGAVALEPQHYPDSPNQPSFPSTILRPGGTLRSRSEYRFGVD